MNNLRGKVAFVTGVASKRGMGHCIALELAKEGANVVVVDQFAAPASLWGEDQGKKWKGLDAVVEEIEAQGQEGLAVVADVSKSNEVNTAVEKALARFDKIDILVNNAGTVGKRATVFLELTEDEWSKPLAVNVTGPFLVSKEIAKSMIAKEIRGKIINIASTAARMPHIGHASYNVSKAALYMLTQCMALELAPHKINVNTVCPGPTSSNLRDEWAREQAERLGITIDEAREGHYAERVAKIPMKREGTPDDIANAVLFLASDKSDHITGQAIWVNGGWYMH